MTAEQIAEYAVKVKEFRKVGLSKKSAQKAAEALVKGRDVTK